MVMADAADAASWGRMANLLAMIYSRTRPLFKDGKKLGPDDFNPHAKGKSKPMIKMRMRDMKVALLGKSNGKR